MLLFTESKASTPMNGDLSLVLSILISTDTWLTLRFFEIYGILFLIGHEIGEFCTFHRPTFDNGSAWPELNGFVLYVWM